nr:MAG TPA: hypothetical protein [Caudoviricetes sp.]
MEGLFFELSLTSKTPSSAFQIIVGRGGVPHS